LSTLGSKTPLISTRVFSLGIDTPIPESERSNFVANAWSIRIETAHARICLRPVQKGGESAIELGFSEHVRDMAPEILVL